MSLIFPSALGRRQFLQAGLACAVGALSRPVLADDSPAGRDGLTTTVQPGQARVPMVGNGSPQTEVWAYNGAEPGPVLRVRQGTPFRATVENGLTENTTVHWHGIRLPNAMDGVPYLTQKPIKPGERFEYAFTPPDAGTFWYHSHDDSLVQMGRGLAGALIVEEAEPPAVDRELLWTIQDWRLTDDAQIAPGFNNRMEAAMDGRVGNTVTINGRVPDTVNVRAGERIRLRLLNAAIARSMALRFEGHRPTTVALDGQPCEPHDPVDGRILLGPAMRADVILDMQGEPGRWYQVVDDFYDRLAYTLVRLEYDKAAPARLHPSDASLRLPSNPVPRPNLKTASVHEVQLQGGMMGGTGMGGGMMGMGGNAAWAINDRRWQSRHAAALRDCARPELHSRHAQRHRLVAPDAPPRSQLSGARSRRPARAAWRMGRHRARPSARAGASRVRRGQSRRLDAALPRHGASGRWAHDDHPGDLNVCNFTEKERPHDTTNTLHSARLDRCFDVGTLHLANDTRGIADFGDALQEPVVHLLRRLCSIPREKRLQGHCEADQRSRRNQPKGWRSGRSRGLPHDVRGRLCRRWPRAGRIHSQIVGGGACHRRNHLAWHALGLPGDDRLENGDLDHLCRHERRQAAKSLRDCVRRLRNANGNDTSQFARFDQRADAFQMAGPQAIVAWRFCVGADWRGARLAMELAGRVRCGSVACQRGAVRRDVRPWSLHASHVQPHWNCGTKQHFTKLVT